MHRFYKVVNQTPIKTMFTLKKKGKSPISAACTFSGCIESDQSAKTYGEKREAYTHDDFTNIAKQLDEMNAVLPDDKAIGYSIHNLSDGVKDAPDAYLMTIDNLLTDQTVKGMWESICKIKYEDTDHHMWSYGKCKVKDARLNTNIGDVAQKGDLTNPDPEKRLSSIIHYDDMPAFKHTRELFNAFDIEKMQNLFCELNFYFPGGGIGEHGDRERNQVMCVNLSPGIKRKIQFRWWHKNRPASELMTFNLPHGGIYMMCGKTTGSDWKKSSIMTLRHRAGAGDGVFLGKADKVMASRAKKRGWVEAEKPSKKIKV
jgi:alkylated DNA repair dioxygenase AlkB